MRQKAICTAIAVAAICVAVPAAPALSQGPYDQPPTFTPKKTSKAKKGKVKAGRATCGTGTCTVSGRAQAKIAGKGYKARVKGVTIAPGGKAKVTIRLSKGGRSAIADARKGIVKFTITVASTSGQSVTKRGKIKIKG